MGNCDVTLVGTRKLRFVEPQGGSIKLSGIRFLNWEYVIQSPLDGLYTTPELAVTRCEFESVNFAIDHPRPCGESLVALNDFRSVRNGIRIGYNSHELQDKWTNQRIIGNYAKGITGNRNADTYFALVYGKHGIVADNILDSISASGTAEAWGIYTKLRFGQIVANNIRNLTSERGSPIFAIQIKSPPRMDESAPLGFGVTCANNSIRQPGTGRGISMQGQDLNVIGNYIEGCNWGICTSGRVSGLQIAGNKIVGPAKSAGNYGINVNHTGDDCLISGNTVRTVERGLNLAASGVDNIQVAGNNIADCGGVAIHCGGGAKGLLSISGNQVAGATRFCYLDGAGTLLVQGNNFVALSDPPDSWIDAAATSSSALVNGNTPITLQTRDAAPRTAFRWRMPDKTALTIDVSAIAQQSDGTNRAMYGKRAMFFCDGGPVTQQGRTLDVFHETKTDATWGGISFGVVDSQARILVTGKAATTIRWSLDVKVHAMQ